MSKKPISAALAAAALISCLALSSCGDDMDYVPLTVTTKDGASQSPESESSAAATASAPEKTDLKTTATAAPEASQTTVTTTEKAPEKAEDPLSDEEYLEKSLFIGDSLCSGLSTYLDEYTNGGNVLTYRDGRTTNMFTQEYNAGGKDLSLDQAFEELAPEYVYFFIGSNEISVTSAAKYAENLKALVEAVVGDSDVKIGLVSMAPVGSSYKVSLDKVREYNAEIQKLCDSMGENVHYIDIYSALTGEDGYLSPAYDSGDGLHIIGKGYSAISEAILGSKM